MFSENNTEKKNELTEALTADFNGWSMETSETSQRIYMILKDFPTLRDIIKVQEIMISHEQQPKVTQT